MRAFKHIFLSAIIASIPALAQDPVPDQQELLRLYRENNELQKQLSEKDQEMQKMLSEKDQEIQKQLSEKDLEVKARLSEKEKLITGLNDSIGIFRREAENLRNELQNLKDAAANSEVEKQNLLKEIEAERNAAANSGMEQEIADLKNRVDNLQNQLLAKDDQIESARRENQLMKDELNNLGKFKKEYLTMMAKNVESDWINKKLSEINLTDLEYAIGNYSAYADQDPRLADAAAKLKTLKANTETYQKALQLINSQYDAKEVSATQRALNRVINSLTNPVQADEVDMVSIKLADYPGAVASFKDVIKRFDEIIDGEDNHSAAISMLEITLEDSDEEPLQRKIKQIKSIPWLEGMYQKYYESLKRDSKSPNATRVVILSL